MQVIPDTEQGQIQFCQSHVQTWMAAASEIGVSNAQVAELGALTQDAAEAHATALRARAAARAATLLFKSKTNRMRGAAAMLVRVIKTHAEMSANPSDVYGAAAISQPAAPSALPAPGTPHSVTSELNPSGSITLRWQARNGAPTTGAVFEVMRRITGVNTMYTSIGFGISTGQGRFEFTDHTLPAGCASAGYFVIGKRGTRHGEPSAAITVQFGVGSILSASDSVSRMKMAA